MSVQPAHNLSLEEMDKQSFLHPYTALQDHAENGPTIVASAQGVNITDTKGKEYIDSMAGLWCVNIGWGRDEVVEAITEQASKLAYYHSFASMANEASIRLADRILRLAPDNMSKVFFGNSGSDANDTNVKLVWYYNNLRGKPDKKKIIGRERGYHGVTVAAASMTGIPMVHKAFDIPLPQMLHTVMPHYYMNAEPGMSELEFSKWCAAKLEEMIIAEGPDTIAAFIAEPVMGAGGVVPPPEGYFQEIQAVLSKYDVLMIADEVITGFGRTGNWFASETYGIKPDIMTIAKGLTSGYIPMSGSIISEDIWQVLVNGTPEVGAFAHGYTYSAHPVAAAAAMANLDIMEREDLPANAARMGTYFQNKLKQELAGHPLVGDVRGVALLAGVELVADKANKTPLDMNLKAAPTLGKYCVEEGLISRALMQMNALSFSPPLVINEGEVDEVVARFQRALNRLTDDLVKSGSWKEK
ncbi:MAG: aminotransferase class III-fold pyridoxal phosphate-dependent enzyme [Rhodospirillaceae bacterium]|mgnify:CR=1 FL=1|jgi:L-2,4-diaminobutyrate transaminase|nr:aminotransferase class III-fold pyridoxal phosphate-dependent enzyme [Rhodospirillaceae bacterium]MBT4426485.1 aminotransferase class III-fold pyridoxal phosphate-dependent enzyme [Rhodospirillaceae bacterium]MBT5780750.1 aminotransferase class III-fold pyridoxal phosphate-dependent enzyme [Rhodospirillaceae bacterium]MBT7293820.1 aminotransferase class III-fold pyridoxal phosphate-dependent enzyme [Rhodospirillaceae bacterium]